MGLNEVLAEIAKIEKKKAKLAKKAAKGGVKGKAAQNEIEQIEASDPMPLRKAMVTAKAALKKAQKSDNVAAQGKMWFVQREIEEGQSTSPRPTGNANERRATECTTNAAL